jgi:hypothetical protein
MIKLGKEELFSRKDEPGNRHETTRDIVATLIGVACQARGQKLASGGPTWNDLRRASSATGMSGRPASAASYDPMSSCAIASPSRTLDRPFTKPTMVIIRASLAKMILAPSVNATVRPLSKARSAQLIPRGLRHDAGGIGFETPRQPISTRPFARLDKGQESEVAGNEPCWALRRQRVITLTSTNPRCQPQQ